MYQALYTDLELCELFEWDQDVIVQLFQELGITAVNICGIVQPQEVGMRAVDNDYIVNEYLSRNNEDQSK